MKVFKFWTSTNSICHLLISSAILMVCATATTSQVYLMQLMLSLIHKSGDFDSSSRSLKAVLLHNGNKYPSIPVAHSVHLKEDYNNVKTLLEMLKYATHSWEVIGDFKMVAFLMGLHGGYTKYPCYLCLWDSRDKKAHYHQKDWPQRTEFSLGKSNVKWEMLVELHKVLMPPFHIKFGLMKQFVTAVD